MNGQSSLATRTDRRLRWRIWLAVALVAAGVAVAWYLTWPGMLLDSAERALLHDDPVSARGFLDRYRYYHPANREALLLSAHVARRTDDFSGAERFLGEFEQIGRPNAASRLEWAMLGAQQGDMSGEPELLQLVANKSSESPAILETLARGYNIGYRWLEAIDTLNFILDRNSSQASALVLRATIFEHLRRHDAALQDLRKAVETSPRNAAAQAALANRLLLDGFTREAILHFELARQLKPADPKILLGLARALTDDADLVEADQRLDELLAAYPDNPDGLVEKGRLAVRQEHFPEAEPYLARAVKVAPWHQDGQSLNLVVLKELGRHQDAVECEHRLAELRGQNALGGRLKLRAHDNQRDTNVRWDLWQWSQRNGQFEEGLAWLTEVLRIDPQNAQAHEAFADYFEKAGQPRRAAQHRADTKGATANAPALNGDLK